jgi:hypothetical protein
LSAALGLADFSEAVATMAAVVEPLRMPGRAGDPVAIPALGAVLEAAGRRVDPVVVVADSGCGVGLTEVEAASLAFESGVTLTFFYSLLCNCFNVWFKRTI